MPKPNFTDFLDLEDNSKSKSASRRGATVAVAPARAPAPRKGGKIRIIDSDAEVPNPIAAKSSRGWFGSFYKKPHAPTELEADDGVIVEPLLDSDSSYVASLAQVSEAIAQNQSPVRSEPVRQSPPGVVPVVAPPVGNTQVGSILPSAPAELKVVPAPQARPTKQIPHHVVPGTASPTSAGVRRFGTQSSSYANHVAPPIVVAQAQRNKQGMASFTAQKITITSQNESSALTLDALQQNSNSSLEIAAIKSRLTPNAPPLNPGIAHSEFQRSRQGREVSVFAARRAQEQARANNQRASGLSGTGAPMNFGRGMAFRDTHDVRNETRSLNEGNDISSNITPEPTHKRKFASAIDLATSLLAKALSKSEESANNLANLAALSYFSTHGLEVAEERDATIDTTPLFKPTEGVIAPPVMGIAPIESEYLKQFSIDSRVVLPTASSEATSASSAATSLALGQLGQISTPLASATIEKADACEVAGVQANLPSGVTSTTAAKSVNPVTPPQARIASATSVVTSTQAVATSSESELEQRAQAVSTASNVSKARASTSALKTKIITPPALRAFAFKTKDSTSNVNVELVNALTTSQANSQAESSTQGVRIFAPSLGAGAARGVQALNFGLGGFEQVTKNQQLEDDLALLGAPSGFMSKLGVFGPDGERVRQQKEQAKQQKIEFDALALKRWAEQRDEPEYYGQDFYVEDGSVRPMLPNNMQAQDRQTASEYFDLRLNDSTSSNQIDGYNEKELDVLMQSFTADAQGNDIDKARNLAEQSFSVPKYEQEVSEIDWDEEELEELAEFYEDDDLEDDVNKGFNPNFVQAAQQQTQGQSSFASALASKSRADAQRGEQPPRAYATHDKFATSTGQQLEKELAAQEDHSAMQGLMNRRGKSVAMQQTVSAEIHAIAASLTAHESELELVNKQEVAHSQPLFVENEQQVFATQVYSGNQGETFIIKIPTKTVDPLQQNKIPHAAQMTDVTLSEVQAYDELVRRVTSGFIPPPVFVNSDSAITKPLSSAEAAYQKEQRIRAKSAQATKVQTSSEESFATSATRQVHAELSVAEVEQQVQAINASDTAPTLGLKHVVSAAVDVGGVPPDAMPVVLGQSSSALATPERVEVDESYEANEARTYHAYIGEPHSYSTVDTSTLAERKMQRPGVISPIAQQLMLGEQNVSDSHANETVSIVKGNRSFQGSIPDTPLEPQVSSRKSEVEYATVTEQNAAVQAQERANAKILTRIQTLEASVATTLASETLEEHLDLNTEFATLGAQLAEVETQLQALVEQPAVPSVAKVSVYNETANYGKVRELHAQSSRTGLSVRQEEYREHLDGYEIYCPAELDLVQAQQYLWLIQEEFQTTPPELQLSADQRMELRHQCSNYTEDGFNQRSFNAQNVLPVPVLSEQEIIYHLLASEFIDFTEDEELIRAIRRNYAQIADLLIEHARTKARQEQNRIIVEQILRENALRQAGYNHPPSIGNVLDRSRQQVYSSVHNFAGITEPVTSIGSEVAYQAQADNNTHGNTSTAVQTNQDLRAVAGDNTPLASALATSLGGVSHAPQRRAGDLQWQDLVQSLGGLVLDRLDSVTSAVATENQQHLGLDLEDTEIIFADHQRPNTAPTSCTTMELDLPIAMHVGEEQGAGEDDANHAHEQATQPHLVNSPLRPVSVPLFPTKKS